MAMRQQVMAGQFDEHKERVSLEAYLALLERDPEHKYEYLDGEVYMMTGGSPDHAIIGSNIARIFGTMLHGRRCIVYNSDLYVELTPTSRVCPDMTVSCDPRDRGAKDTVKYPSLVIEVISPSSEARDRGKKAQLYRSSLSIQEFLLISSEVPTAEVWRREKNGLWTVRTPGLADSIELTGLDIRFPVAEVFEDTSLITQEE